jgi:hypothetical protein
VRLKQEGGVVKLHHLKDVVRLININNYKENARQLLIP